MLDGPLISTDNQNLLYLYM